MKKTIVALVMAFFLLKAGAQDIKTANKLYDAGQLDKAKQAIDDAIAKDGSKPDVWLAKHKIYYAIATSDAYKNLVPDAKSQGYQALLKGRKMPKGQEAMIMQGILDPNKPFSDYYYGFINDGSANMNANNFSEALSNFKMALQVSKFFYDEKILSNELDTSIVFYSGYTAMKADKNDDAELYFKKLVDKNISGTDINIAYEWLCQYYLETKKDPAKAKEVMQKGLALYPNDEFLKSKKIEIVRASGKMDDLFNEYEALIASGKAEPSDYMNYGAELYDYVYFDSTSPVAERPAKEKRMVEILTKAHEKKGGSAEVNYLLGLAYTQRAIDGDKAAKAIKGTKPEDVAKKKAATAEANANTDNAIKYLEVARSIYRARSNNFKNNEQEHYCVTLKQLSNLYTYKGLADKVKSVKEDVTMFGKCN
jgi:tetratricopeptide (TPR) repeat protein